MNAGQFERLGEQMQRLRRPTPAGTMRRPDLGQEVEIRDLGAYERLCLAEVES